MTKIAETKNTNGKLPNSSKIDYLDSFDPQSVDVEMNAGGNQAREQTEERRKQKLLQWNLQHRKKMQYVE